MPMKKTTNQIIEHLLLRYPDLSGIKEQITTGCNMILACYRRNNKLLVCGNGGSAADSDHIVGELMKGFLLERRIKKSDGERFVELFGKDGEYIAKHLQRALPAIALTNHTALATAFGNDAAADMTFAQQVFGYGEKGDVLLCISTSGNSVNIRYAAQVAISKEIQVVGLTGIGGGTLATLSDCLIAVPAKETYKIQELHLPIYHVLCAAAENEMFGTGD